MQIGPKLLAVVWSKDILEHRKDRENFLFDMKSPFLWAYSTMRKQSGEPCWLHLPPLGKKLPFILETGSRADTFALSAQQSPLRTKYPLSISRLTSRTALDVDAAKLNALLTSQGFQRTSGRLNVYAVWNVWIPVPNQILLKFGWGDTPHSPVERSEQCYPKNIFG